MAGKQAMRDFTVTVEMPPGVTVEDMKAYIEQAVRCWCGRFSPDDAISALNRKKVRVRRVPLPPAGGRQPVAQKKEEAGSGG